MQPHNGSKGEITLLGLSYGASAFSIVCGRLKILGQQLVVPDFHQFASDLEALYHLVENDVSGKNADYIPMLRCGTSCRCFLLCTSRS